MNYRGLSEEFVQHNRLTGVRRSFQLYKDSHLFQMFDWYRDKEKKKYRINLACLNAKPVHHIDLQWKWVTTAIATAIWAVILIYTGYFTDVARSFSQLEPLHVISAGVLMATITIISLLLFVYYREDKTIFRSYQGDITLIVLDTDKPDAATFQRLQSSIISAIRKSVKFKDTQEILVTELKELRRLRDEGVIADKDYESARGIIFSHEGFSSAS
jgi:hypothetical protein